MAAPGRAGVGGRPLVGDGLTIPTQTRLSVEISRALKTKGFKFVGPTIVYAFMQATGMVNDHLVSCYRHEHLTGAKK